MSGNGDDDKVEGTKIVPLDLASKVTNVKSMDGKTPLLVAGTPLRGMRVLTQSTSGQSNVGGSTIITTSLVPQAVLKPGLINSSQSTAGITIQRPTQITLATPIATPPSGTTYHVPRGPAVVANLAAPRSNVATAIRAPMVVTQTTGQGFVRPPRTPSPAQGTAWLATNSANSSQIKGAPTVLSSPIRGPSVAGKSQIVNRCQSVTQSASTIRPATATILHSAITIGQGGQIHPFKSTQGPGGIQGIGNTVTLAQVLPSRTQTLVYSSSNNAHFAPKLSVASNMQNQRQISTPRPMNQVTATRLTMPVTITQSGNTRLVTPQATVLTSGTRISSVTGTQSSGLMGTQPTRIVSTTQANVSLGRLAVTVANQQANANILGQTRISTLSLHPLVAVANSQSRNIQAQGAKVIAQPTQGTAIHLTQIPASIKSTQNVVTTSARAINVPAAIMAQRQNSVAPSQTIPIAKVFPQQEGQQSVFIHAPVAPRRSSPSLATTQTTTSATTTTLATYSISGGPIFYDASGNYSVTRSFNQQPTTFASLPQSATQQIRPNTLGTHVQNIVTNQNARFNPIVVVESNRNQFSQETSAQESHAPTKMTSSPRPSILRKRDYDGSPLKAAKNLTPVLATLPQAPISPPSRPDSRGNGHSSGGSTTISATSSPGLAEANDDSLLHIPMNVKEEESRPPLEMSPRKKPRKQQLTGNDIDEHNDDMQFLSDNNMKKEADDSDGNRSDGPKDGAPEASQISAVRKPASASLLNSYRQTWKTTHNHYLRYSDVRPKDERKPTIIDLANQTGVMEKVNGWKIHHLSTQMEDLADQEDGVHDQLTELLRCMETREGSKPDKEVDCINELIKGNLQRVKIINEGMVEAKTQIMKIFDHKVHVTDIISRCASKRNFKKREKP